LVEENKRQKRREVPPFLSLEESVEICNKSYFKAGGDVSEDQLVNILDNPLTSSVYLQKRAALRAWGLISKDENNKYKLSSDAESIVQPKSEQDKRQALLNCFLRVDQRKRIAQNYAGKMLPDEQYFINSLVRELKIDHSVAKSWAKTFEESGKLAGIFIDVKGRLQIRKEYDKTTAERVIELDTPPPPPPLPPDEKFLPPPPSSTSTPFAIPMGPISFRGPQPTEEDYATDIQIFFTAFQTKYKKLLKPEGNK